MDLFDTAFDRINPSVGDRVVLSKTQYGHRQEVSATFTGEHNSRFHFRTPTATSIHIDYGEKLWTISKTNHKGVL